MVTGSKMARLWWIRTSGQDQRIFKAYISGMALTVAAETAGLKLHHGCAGRMLRNKRYLGDAYYPAIIDQKIFDKAEEKRMEKARSLEEFVN